MPGGPSGGLPRPPARAEAPRARGLGCRLSWETCAKRHPPDHGIGVGTTLGDANPLAERHRRRPPSTAPARAPPLPSFPPGSRAGRRGRRHVPVAVSPFFPPPVLDRGRAVLPPGPAAVGADADRHRHGRRVRRVSPRGLCQVQSPWTRTPGGHDPAWPSGAAGIYPAWDGHRLDWGVPAACCSPACCPAALFTPASRARPSTAPPRPALGLSRPRAVTPRWVRPVRGSWVRGPGQQPGHVAIWENARARRRSGIGSCCRKNRNSRNLLLAPAAAAPSQRLKRFVPVFPRPSSAFVDHAERVGDRGPRPFGRRSPGRPSETVE